MTYPGVFTNAELWILLLSSSVFSIATIRLMHLGLWTSLFCIMYHLGCRWKPVYSAVNFPTNIHKRHPKARPLGELWVCFVEPASDWYFASLPAIIYVISYDIGPCFIAAMDCICIAWLLQHICPISSQSRFLSLFVHIYEMVKWKIDNYNIGGLVH